MYTPMQEMSFWQLVKNSPEWVGVIANSLFAGTTIGVIIWQVRVMLWQARNSEHHERIQSRLIRLQHEHEWLLRLNAEREQVLKSARKLHLRAASLKPREQSCDQINWEELQDTAYELSQRLSILDLSAYSSEFDNWYPSLTAYVDAVLKAVLDDQKLNETYTLTDQIPNLSTREALKVADESYKPIKIFLDLEAAIRMGFFDFKQKWDAVLPS